MATNRFQFSDDFVLKNGRVGINSADPQAELDVRGTIKADNLTVTGFATFTSYEGFLRSDYNIDESLTITNGSALSGEVIVGTGVTATNNAIDYAGQGQIDSLKVYNTFTPPRGGTEERPTKAKPGQLYYNEDFKTIEFYDGDRWRQVDNTTTRGRGVFNLGFSPATTALDFINIQSTGNASNFGDLTVHRGVPGSASSQVRGLFSSGYNSGGNRQDIDYITIASQGNAINFGNGTVAREELCGCSSSTRGLFVGSGPSGIAGNVIDYVEISTIGNAIDFGDLTIGRSDPTASSSPTRALICNGGTPGGIGVSSVDTVIISSKGNAVSFGSMTYSTYRRSNGSISSGTKGIVGGATGDSNGRYTIESIILTSSGNAQDFGDLTVNRSRLGATSSTTRGIFAGGENSSVFNTIDYITISSFGNAQDFGDLTRIGQGIAGLSDSHGGLGGF